MPIEFQCKRTSSLCKLDVIIYFKIGVQQSLTNVRNNVPESHNCRDDQRSYRALGVEDFIATVDTWQVKCVSHVWFRRYFITENNCSVDHPVCWDAHVKNYCA